MSGIACASDTDRTVYQLSRSYPLAVAVNSYSPIPWDSIINSYKRLGEPEEKENFEDYAKDFEKFLSSIPVTEDYQAYQRMIQTSFSWVMVKKIYFLRFSTLVFV